MKTMLILICSTFLHLGGQIDKKEESKPECRVTVTITYIDENGTEHSSTASGGGLFTSCENARAIAEERAARNLI